MRGVLQRKKSGISPIEVQTVKELIVYISSYPMLVCPLFRD